MRIYPTRGGTRKQLPQRLASSSAGIPLSFDGLSVTRQGLSLDHGRKTFHGTRWARLRSATIMPSRSARGEFWDWYANASMPNV